MFARSLLSSVILLFRELRLLARLWLRDLSVDEGVEPLAATAEAMAGAVVVAVSALAAASRLACS